MDRLQALETFVKVAQTGNFSTAARQLELSRSVVTERIQQLERYVGAPLFHRSTRSVRLTDAGAQFLSESAEVVQAAQNTLDRVRDRVGSSPTGTLRIHLLPGLAGAHFADFLAEFQLRYPKVRIALEINDNVIDPVKEGFHCAVQVFDPVSEDLVSRQLFTFKRVFCASPSYLSAQGIPRLPAELRSHRLGLYSRYPTGTEWIFESGGSRSIIQLEAGFLANSVQLLRHFALAGAGIVCIPTIIAADAIASGQLKRVLEDFTVSPLSVCAVYPQSMRGGYMLQTFLDGLVQHFNALDWDRALT